MVLVAHMSDQGSIFKKPWKIRKLYLSFYLLAKCHLALKKCILQ